MVFLAKATVPLTRIAVYLKKAVHERAGQCGLMIQLLQPSAFQFQHTTEHPVVVETSSGIFVSWAELGGANVSSRGALSPKFLYIFRPLIDSKSFPA